MKICVPTVAFIVVGYIVFNFGFGGLAFIVIWLVDGGFAYIVTELLDFIGSFFSNNADTLKGKF